MQIKYLLLNLYTEGKKNEKALRHKIEEGGDNERRESDREE